jgi:hypothetical protein
MLIKIKLFIITGEARTEMMPRLSSDDFGSKPLKSDT